MRKHLIITLVLLGLALPLGQARADDLSEAIDAYGEGDYSTALRTSSALAEQGDDLAQSFVGNMYYRGWGIPERKDKGNLLFAYMWLSLASGQGFEEAKEPRDEIRNSMTSAGISIAQDIARECFENNYKGCGF